MIDAHIIVGVRSGETTAEWRQMGSVVIVRLQIYYRWSWNVSKNTNVHLFNWTNSSQMGYYIIITCWSSWVEHTRPHSGQAWLTYPTKSIPLMMIATQRGKASVPRGLTSIQLHRHIPVSAPEMLSKCDLASWMGTCTAMWSIFIWIMIWL